MAESRWTDRRCTSLDVPAGVLGNFIELADGSLMTIVDNKMTYRDALKSTRTSTDDGAT
jgi:hypothetical protein